MPSSLARTVRALIALVLAVTGLGAAALVSAGPAAAVGPAVGFTITGPATAQAGVPVSFTVTATDATMTGTGTYTGTAKFTSSDAAATLPADGPLTSNPETITVVFRTSGAQTVTVTDSAVAAMTKTSGATTVAATHFAVTAATPVTAGTAENVMVTAQDTNNVTVTGYTGTVHLTSNDAAAALPTDAALTSGSGTFPVTFKTPGSRTVTATDTKGVITGTSNAVVVNPGPAAKLVVTAPATATAGTAVTVTVATQDAAGNAAPSTDPVTLTSSDTTAVITPASTMLAAGTATFTVTFKTAGSQTLTATDTATMTTVSTGMATVAVSTSGATHFVVTAPATATAGTAVTVTVMAKDASENTVTGFTGTVHLTSTDTTATITPNDVALTNGSGTFSVTFKKTGAQTVTASSGTAPATITGTSGTVTVSSGTATQLSVVASPTSTTTGGLVTVTVTAKDSLGNTATGYAGTIHFKSSDPAASLPGDYTFVAGDMGSHTFTNMVTFSTTGSQTVTATQTPAVTPSVTGTSNPVTVAAPTPATKFAVTAPTTATKGSAVMITVQAKDANNASTTGFTGTVHVSSSDAAATLPADFTVNGGLGTFTVTFNTPGTQTVTVTATTGSPAITGTSNQVTVGVTPVADHFLVSAPGTAAAGTAFSVVVTAKDSSNNTVTGYVGTVKLTSTDTMAVLPANYTFVATDMGTKTFSVTLKTSGSQTVTATDATTSTVTGTSGPITVAAGTATKLLVTAPATAAIGTPVSVVVKAQDAFGNTAAGYVGTVKLTSTDAMAVLPANYTFTTTDAGTHTLMVTFKTSGSQTVTATDTVTSTITGTSATVTVGNLVTTTAVGSNPSTIKALVTATPASGSTGTPPTPTGTVAFTVNGVAVGTATLSNGLATLAYTLKPGSQAIVATYAGDTGFMGSTGNRTVTGPKVTATPTSSAPKSSYGWYHTNVKVSYTCTAGSAAVLACPKLTTLSQEGKAVTVTKTVIDKDGGRTVVTTTVMIDKTKPTLTVGGVQNGHTYAHAPHLSCKASDSLSGVASCTITKQRTGKTVAYTATALDKAGNQTVVKGTYKLR